MKKKIAPVLTVMALIFLVLIAGAATMLVKRYMPSKESMTPEEYFNLDNANEAALVVNGQLAEEKILFMDGRYYVEDVVAGKYINSRFYWDDQQKLMIYTLPEELLMIYPDTDQYQTSQGIQTMDFTILKTVNDKYYLDMEFVGLFTDMESEMYENPARVVIHTSSESVRTVKAAADGSLRVRGGIKSLIVDTVQKGEQLVLEDQMEDWSKVSTKDGYTGYIENKKLSQAEETVRQIEKKEPEYTNITRDHKISLVWHQVTSQEGNESFASMMAGVTGVNTVSPTWFSVTDDQGTISSLADEAYVKQAHDWGMEVWGLIDNFNKDVDTLTVLSSMTVRGHIIQQLLDEASRVGLDGINVDFESITEEQGPHYVQFIRELSVACRINGLVLSVDDPVPMPYTDHYDRREQGVVADYVIIMGYDEHYAGSREPGSVASIGFVKDGIEGTLAQVPEEKVINGIPFYTRVWTEPFGGGNLTSEVLGMEGAYKYIADNGMEMYWDDTAGQNAACLETDHDIRRIWVEDEQSVEEKMKLVQQYQLAGAAFWKLGLQRDSVWPVIQSYLQ